MNRVLRHLHRAALLCDGGALTDRQLLDCFLSRRDEAAFAALVQRHGPMVFAVCRRVLGNRHDAEDAFQAAFLVLVRKAASLRARELLGNWLYGVAYRTALKARVMAARRQARERRAAVRAAAVAPAGGPGEELLPLLDRELSRLPEKYRAAVVLCELEGRSRREAAGLLKVPEGTVSSRLAKARKLLAARLARYGLAPAGAALAALAAAGGASAGVPPALLTGTARSALLIAGGQVAAAGLVPAEVAVLTEGVLKTMLLAKVKTTAAVVLSVVVLGLGTGGLVYRARVAASEPPGQQRAKAPEGPVRGQAADPSPERQAEAALREARARAEEAEVFARQARADAEQAKALAEQERRRAEEALQRAREVERQQKDFERQALEARRLLEQSRSEAERAGRAARQTGDDERPQAVDPEGRLRDLRRSVEERVKALADRRARLQAEMQEVEQQAKAVMQDYKRQVEVLTQTQKAPQKQGDKLDQILERLERLEKRLDRLEQRR
jgi:RNA polymerase sigma factor (sigma-70 family)